MMHALVFSATLLAQATSQITGHTRDVSSIAISPNGKVLASGSVDLSVRLWDPATKRNLAVLEGHDGEVQALAFSPDSKLLASGEMYKKVRIWDVASGKQTQIFTDMEGKVFGLAFTPDGKRLVAAVNDNSARVWTVGASAPAKVLKHNYAVAGVSVSPDGKTIATIDEGGSVHLWDASTLKMTKSLGHGETTAGRMSVAFSADGKWIVSAGSGLVKVWDATGTEKAAAKIEANSAAFTPDATMVIVGTQDNFVMALNSSDLSVKWKAEKHERPVTGIAVSPDGKMAYSSSMDMTLRTWALK